MRENRLVYQETPKQNVSSLNSTPEFKEYKVVSDDNKGIIVVLKKIYGEKYYPSDDFLREFAEYNDLKITEKNGRPHNIQIKLGQILKCPLDPEFFLKKETVKKELKDQRGGAGEVVSKEGLQKENKDKQLSDLQESYKVQLDKLKFGPLEKIGIKTTDENKEKLKNSPYEIAKVNLSKALAFIETYVTLENEEEFKLSYDTSWYLALLAKESLFDPNAKSEFNARGYFQLLPGAVSDVKNKGSYNFKSNNVLKGDKNEYITNPVANCVYGILYLELKRRNLDKNTAYKHFSSDDKNKLAFYAYNKGAGNLMKIFKDCPKTPEEFNDFEVMIAKKFKNQFNSIEAFDKEIKSMNQIQSSMPDVGMGLFNKYIKNYFEDYKSTYYVEYFIPNSFVAINRIINDQSHDLRNKMKVKYFDGSSKYSENSNLTYANVREMVEYYRIIEAIKKGEGFLERSKYRKDYLLKHNIHIVDSSKQDSLYAIAKLYPGISANNIMLANNMKSDKIYSGDKLVIPVGELRVPEEKTINDVLKNIEL